MLLRKAPSSLSGSLVLLLLAGDYGTMASMEASEHIWKPWMHHHNASLGNGKVCRVEKNMDSPGTEGLKKFADNCEWHCPFATKRSGQICKARCTDKCGEIDQAKSWTDEKNKLCKKCTVGCFKCATAETCQVDGCAEGWKFAEGQCALPAERIVKHIVFYTFASLVAIILILLLCFGSMRNQFKKALKKANSAVQEPFLSSEDGRTASEVKLGDEASVNWEIMKHAFECTRLSSIAASRSRRRMRRRALFHHKSEKANDASATKTASFTEFLEKNSAYAEKYLAHRCLKHLFPSIKSMAGVGMLLFQNTQRFYLANLIILFVSMMYWKVDLSEEISFCNGEASGSKGKGHDDTSFIDKCCSGNPLQTPYKHGVMIFWWGIFMWIILFVLSIVFSWFQTLVVKADETYQQGFGIDEQDYTCLLQNVPKNITSEEYLKKELEKKLGMEGKIYGVSIVYDVKEAEWEARIKEMLENLVRYDIAMEENYPRQIRDLYTLTTPLDELKEKHKKDGDDFKDWLMGKGELGSQRKGKPITSGEAYVVFKRKVDLKMFLPCVSAIRWPVEADPTCFPYKADPYHIVKVEEVQWEPSDVMWMDCVPNPKEMKMKIFTSSITMVFMLSAMLLLTGAVFYSSILPYQFVGADPQESSNFTLMNQLLVFVCMLIPGMPAGLAQGIGYTKMNDMEGFIFTFIFYVFFTWNFTTISVQWGVVGLDPFKLLDPVNASTIDDVLLETKWAEVVPNVMFPGQMVQGYIVNELLTALLPLLIPSIVTLLVYVLHVFPACIRQIVASAMLQSPNYEKIDAYKFENLIMMQPYRLSMEYAFMVWVPLLSLSVLVFLTDKQGWIFGGLIIYAVLMLIFVQVCCHTMRDTSFDSVKAFVSFTRAWSTIIAALPCLSVWWALRLEWISPKIGLIMVGLTFVALKLLHEYVLNFIGFDDVMTQQLVTEQVDTGANDWKTIEENDRGFLDVLTTSGYSWWNMNPIYVLKRRYAPNLKGYEIHDENESPTWPKGYVRHSYVEVGRDWRFKVGEDPDLSGEKLGEEHITSLKAIREIMEEIG